MSASPRSLDTRRPPADAGVLHTLVSLYSSWSTIALNGALFAAYFLIFYEAILRSNSGYFLLTIPTWLLAAFVLASSSLATVAVSYLRISFRRRVLPGVVGSPAGLAMGTIIATCSCNLPLLAPAMYFVGLNSLEVSGVISFLAGYQESILGAIIAINAASIYYYLRQISKVGLGRTRPPDAHGAPAR